MRRLLVQHRGFLIACSVVLASFQFMLCGIVASINLEAAMDQIMMFAPPVIRAVIEQSMLGGSAAGMLAFAWNHPITHALLTAVAISLAARAIAGEVENGAIEILLAQPISRNDYLVSHVVFGVSSLGLVALAGILGTTLGQAFFHLDIFGWNRLLQLFAGVVLLQAAIYALTLLFSSFGREGGRVALLGVLAAVISYLVNVIAMLWSKASFIKPYSLHSYYDPRNILVSGHLDRTSVLVLAGFALGATAAAFARFRSRDLP